MHALDDVTKMSSYVPIWLATTIIVATVVVVVIVGLLLACIINEHVVRFVETKTKDYFFPLKHEKRHVLCLFSEVQRTCDGEESFERKSFCWTEKCPSHHRH